ncbi:MAG TPA: transcriptional regulator [Phycisphaerales bacterium]|nr:transcriptional regulator [Phycisphaerales bacterium]
MSNNRTTENDRFAGMFKALANPHRLNIFMRLISCCGAGKGPGVDPEKMKTCVGQLGRDLGIVPSTVSHHIKELRQAGLIDMERNGQKIFCRVDPATLKALSSFFVELQESSENNSC